MSSVRDLQMYSSIILNVTNLNKQAVNLKTLSISITRGLTHQTIPLVFIIFLYSKAKIVIQFSSSQTTKEY